MRALLVRAGLVAAVLVAVSSQSQSQTQTRTGTLSPSLSQTLSQTVSQTPSPIPFAAGSILALRGTSSVAFSTASVAIVLDELAYTGGSTMTLVRSLVVPSTTGSARLPCTMPGNANLDGRLTQSSAGSVVTFGCYMAISATASIASTFSTVVSRAIITVRQVRTAAFGRR